MDKVTQLNKSPVSKKSYRTKVNIRTAAYRINNYSIKRRRKRQKYLQKEREKMQLRGTHKQTIVDKEDERKNKESVVFSS